MFNLPQVFELTSQKCSRLVFRSKVTGASFKIYIAGEFIVFETWDPVSYFIRRVPHILDDLAKLLEPLPNYQHADAIRSEPRFNALLAINVEITEIREGQSGLLQFVRYLGELMHQQQANRSTENDGFAFWCELSDVLIVGCRIGLGDGLSDCLIYTNDPPRLSLFVGEHYRVEVP